METSDSSDAVDDSNDLLSLRDGSVLLTESLVRKRRDSDRAQLKSCTLPRGDPAKTRSASITGDVLPTSSTMRPLTKALQPKDMRRGSHPSVPFQTNLNTTGRGSQFQQQQNSTSGSETWTPQHSVTGRRDAAMDQPEAVNLSSANSRRGVIQEPNPGLMMLRSLQRQRVARDNDAQRGARPEVETSDRRRQSTPTLSTQAVSRRPISAVASESKSAVIAPSTHSTSTDLSSSAVDECTKAVDTEPTLSRVVSNASFDPPLTTSTVVENQRTITVRCAGKSRPEPSSSCQEPVEVTPEPIIQILETSAPISTEDKDPVAEPADGANTAVYPAVRVPDSADIVQACNHHHVEDSSAIGKTQRPDDVSSLAERAICKDEESRSTISQDENVQRLPEPTACLKDKGSRSTKEQQKVLEPTVDPAASDDDEDRPPPLPSVPPPRFHLPPSHDDQDTDDDDDGQVQFQMTMPGGSLLGQVHHHRASDSNATVDSGLDCLTPHDGSSCEEDQEEQHHQTAAAGSVICPRSSTLMVSAGSGSLTPTSLYTDSEHDDARLDLSPCLPDGDPQTPSTKPVGVISAADSSTRTASSSSLAQGDTKLLDRLMAENRTSFDHVRSQTSRTFAVDKPHPVCTPEVARSSEAGDESAYVGTEQTSEPMSCAGDSAKGDVIGSCVSDRRLCCVEVIKGALGLGFCIQGGQGSAAGDRPISVKRLFQAEPRLLGDLRVGDEIQSVNGEDFTQLSHYQAWNRLKAMPDGPFAITVNRHGLSTD